MPTIAHRRKFCATASSRTILCGSVYDNDKDVNITKQQQMMKNQYKEFEKIYFELIAPHLGRQAISNLKFITKSDNVVWYI